MRPCGIIYSFWTRKKEFSVLIELLSQLMDRTWSALFSPSNNPRFIVMTAQDMIAEGSSPARSITARRAWELRFDTTFIL